MPVDIACFPRWRGGLNANFRTSESLSCELEREMIAPVRWRETRGSTPASSSCNQAVWQTCAKQWITHQIKTLKVKCRNMSTLTLNFPKLLNKAFSCHLRREFWLRNVQRRLKNIFNTSPLCGVLVLCSLSHQLSGWSTSTSWFSLTCLKKSIWNTGL